MTNKNIYHIVLQGWGGARAEPSTAGDAAGGEWGQWGIFTKVSIEPEFISKPRRSIPLKIFLQNTVQFYVFLNLLEL